MGWFNNSREHDSKHNMKAGVPWMKNGKKNSCGWAANRFIYRPSRIDATSLLMNLKARIGKEHWLRLESKGLTMEEPSAWAQTSG
jgi:hypothetical protein